MSILNVSVLGDKDILQMLVSVDHGAKHTYLFQESETLNRGSGKGGAIAGPNIALCQQGKTADWWQSVSATKSHLSSHYHPNLTGISLLAHPKQKCIKKGNSADVLSETIVALETEYIIRKTGLWESTLIASRGTTDSESWKLCPLHRNIYLEVQATHLITISNKKRIWTNIKNKICHMKYRQQKRHTRKIWPPLRWKL